MPKEKNTAIGEVRCPHRTCNDMASVFKFRTRAKEAWAQRRAGKLYSACPNGHRCEDQEYLLNEATIWGAENSGESAPVPDGSAPVKTAVKQASAPVPKAPARREPAPAIAPEPERRKSGWGWFK